MSEPTLREALDATWRLPEDAPTERHNRAWYEAGWAERAEAIRQRFRSVPARPEDAALARADDGLDVRSQRDRAIDDLIATGRYVEGRMPDGERVAVPVEYARLGKEQG